MNISLIICTRDRSQQLARCLESVRGITSAIDWELIIVDNGSVDETAEIAHEFIRTATVPTRYLIEPKHGLGNAHNAGVAIARGRILAFTDDDCYPAPDFLEKMTPAFEDPAVGYVTGRIVLHDCSDYPVMINESTIPRTFPGRSFVCAGMVSGANMAFRREAIRDIGGFDPMFGPGSLFNAEDTDAAGRASAIGWKGQYRPEIVVRHHHGRKAADAARLWKSYAIGRGAYHMKLLLRGEFMWFARSVYQLRWRYRTSRGTVLWEQVGAAKYLYWYTLQKLRGPI